MEVLWLIRCPVARLGALVGPMDGSMYYRKHTYPAITDRFGQLQEMRLRQKNTVLTAILAVGVKFLIGVSRRELAGVPFLRRSI